MNAFLYKIIGKFLKLYWKIVKPFSIGVRAIIINENNEILLVQHTNANQWYLPGGGVHKKEHLVDALKRELDEELSLEINSTPTLLGNYANFFEGKSDFISIFIIKEFTLNKFKGNDEIDKWNFFNFDQLPEKTSVGTKKRIDEYLNKKDIDYRW